MEPTLFDTENDLLAQVEAIEIDNIERISQEDRELCQLVQKCCNETLDQLEESYRKMMEDSKPYIDDETVIIKFDETYWLKNDDWNLDSVEGRFKNRQYISCMNEKVIRKLFREACRIFLTSIIDHFNKKYGITVPYSDMYNDVPDIKTFNPSFRPQYNDVVDMVIAHLGGRTFAQTMEDEVYAKALEDYERERMSIKGNSIAIEHYAHSGYFDSELTYDTCRKIERLYDAICYMFTEAKCGYGIQTLLCTNHRPEQGKKYDCILPEIKSFQFFKNDKMEIKFHSALDAQKVYEKLKT